MTTATPRVLVADGDAHVRAAMFRALLDLDVFCDCVPTGGDAIVRLGAQPYAVIVLDFTLPNAGAVAVLESLRALPAAGRPIVVATALTRGAPESDLVQIVFRRPLRIRDIAGVIQACCAQVRTAWPAARNADTARSSVRSGTST